MACLGAGFPQCALFLVAQVRRTAASGWLGSDAHELGPSWRRRKRVSGVRQEAAAAPCSCHQCEFAQERCRIWEDREGFPLGAKHRSCLSRFRFESITICCSGRRHHRIDRAQYGRIQRHESACKRISRGSENRRRGTAIRVDSRSVSAQCARRRTCVSIGAARQVQEDHMGEERAIDWTRCRRLSALLVEINPLGQIVRMTVVS